MFLYDQQMEFDLKEEDKSSIHSSSFLEPDQTSSKLEYEYDGLQGNSSAVNDSRPVGHHARVKQFEEVNMDSYEPEGYYHQMRGDLHTEDADMCFFRSLVPHMKELTPQKRMQLRIKIHEMVYKEVYPDNDQTQEENKKQ